LPKFFAFQFLTSLLFLSPRTVNINVINCISLSPSLYMFLIQAFLHSVYVIKICACSFFFLYKYLIYVKLIWKCDIIGVFFISFVLVWHLKNVYPPCVYQVPIYTWDSLVLTYFWNINAIAFYHITLQ
jgi:hypothetical protein